MKEKIRSWLDETISKTLQSNKKWNKDSWMEFLDDLDEKIVAEDEEINLPLAEQLKNVKNPTIDGFSKILYQLKNLFNKLYLFEFKDYSNDESWKWIVRWENKQAAIKNAKEIYELSYAPEKIEVLTVDKDRLIDRAKVNPTTIFWNKKVNKKQLWEFLVEYASLMEDWFDKQDTIKNIWDIIKDKKIKEFMEELKDSSYKMSKLMEKHWVFDDYTITIIESAESSWWAARFFDWIKHLWKSYIEEEEFKSKFISSLIYPIVLFSIIMIIIYVSLKYVMPALTWLFSEIAWKDNLPWYMLSMIEIWNWINFIILKILMGIWLFYFILKVLSTNSFILVKWNLLKLKMPLIWMILQIIEENRIMRILVQTLDSNLSHLDKIQSFEKSTWSELYKRVFRYMYKIYPLKQNLSKTFEEANEKFWNWIFSQRYLTILKLARWEKPKILQKYNTFLGKNTEKLMKKLGTIKWIITVWVTMSIAGMVWIIFFVITSMVINLTNKI